MTIPRYNLLFVAAASGEGQFRQIVDPALADALALAGFRCHSCYLPQLRPEHLAAASALVIVRTPMPGHAQDDTALFQSWTPRILDAVRNGMGLAIFFFPNPTDAVRTHSGHLPNRSACAVISTASKKPIPRGAA